MFQESLKDSPFKQQSLELNIDETSLCFKTTFKQNLICQEDSKYFVQVLKDCFLSVRFDFHQVASKVNIDVTFFDHFPESISILFDGCRIFQPQMNF